MSKNTIQLKRPFTTAAGLLVSSLTMRECLVSDMKQAQRMGKDDNAAVEIALMGIACDLLPEDMERMTLADYKRVQKRFQELNGDDTEETPQKDGSPTGAVVSDAAV